MADSVDDKAGEGDKTEPVQPQDIHLPMVVAPKLGAGEEDVDAEPETVEPASEPAAPAAQAPSTRFLMLAASVAFAAAFGSLVGSVSGTGLARYLSPAAPKAASENVSEAVRTLNLGLAELNTIKANLDAAARSTNSQIGKIAERLDKLDQRTSAAAADTTGSISNAPAPTEPKLTDRILPDWIVHDVQNGRALVENKTGGMFDVGVGSVLPGVGHVDSIKRQDGQWLVLTARGTITSGR